MSIPPISNHAIAASIAGTDRAAASEVASGAAKRDGSIAASASAEAIVEKAERVKPGDASGDSEADGRQMLDTFERQHRGEDDADSPPTQAPPPVARDPEPLMPGDHIDLTA